MRSHQTRTAALLLSLALAACSSAQTEVQRLPPVRTVSVAPASPASHEAVRSDHGMVASATAVASETGRDILRAGGNAVDAAVATAFALQVTFPSAGNIGGGGFIVIRFPDGKATTFDFREKAPLKAHANMFLDSTGTYSSAIHHNSHFAVGVPGSVAGLYAAHKKYGKLPWADLVRPSVRLAEDGITLTPTLARSLAGQIRSFQRYPASLAAYSKNGTAYEAGEVMKQPDLARTLDRIMRNGHDGFYRGETARLLADEMRRAGGMITEADLAAYQAKERPAIQGTYRGFDVIGMYPPSSGGVGVIEMLNILEGFDLKAMGHNSPSYIHHVAEAMRRAYRDRARHLADPDFSDVPIERLTSKAYAAELRKTIDPKRASKSTPEEIDLAAESDYTTHFSVVDGSGMAVALTTTLEASYGSKIMVPGAGFLLNNEMGDFNAAPGLTTASGLVGSTPNLARPQQRMLSSMTPTIIARNGELVAVIGSPGGRTIINTVLSVALGIMDFGMPIQDAVAAGRMHHQWLPDQLSVEEHGVTPATVAALEAMGHTVRTSGQQGSVHAIGIENGRRVGAPDSKRDGDGSAAGH